MPELPDVEDYAEALRARIVGQPLLGVRLANPFLLRSADPPLSEASGRRVLGVRRLGKRIVLALEGDLHLALHLMIAGRLHWAPRGPGAERAKGGGRRGRALATFEFPNGELVLTEAGS